LFDARKLIGTLSTVCPVKHLLIVFLFLLAATGEKKWSEEIFGLPQFIVWQEADIFQEDRL